MRDTRVYDVFVPGKLPDVTYNPREEQRLEQRVQDYLHEKGSILTIAGPTKTGKTVLLRRVIEDPIWIDGQGIDSVSILWERILHELGAYSGVEFMTGNTISSAGELSANAGIQSLFGFGSKISSSTDNMESYRFSAQYPIEVLAPRMLLDSKKALVIDDFHFIPRKVQREIVRALKPSVHKGLPVILVSISHRVRDVLTAEPDMTGRVKALRIEFWSQEDLVRIARKGFSELNCEDHDDSLALKLASESYGSPHLMQTFCLELCKENDVRIAQETVTPLRAPNDWTIFFKDRVDLSSEDWFRRLWNGPATRGTRRTQWTVSDVDGLNLDLYGLTLMAIASIGPQLEMPKTEIQKEVSRLVTGGGPASDRITRVLKNMSDIAKKRLSLAESCKTDIDDNVDSAGAMDDELNLQPIIEFDPNTPNPSLHIADPFFAFYLKWAAKDLLVSPNANGKSQS